jgi:hypothetical protein
MKKTLKQQAAERKSQRTRAKSKAKSKAAQKYKLSVKMPAYKLTVKTTTKKELTRVEKATSEYNKLAKERDKLQKKAKNEKSRKGEVSRETEKALKKAREKAKKSIHRVHNALNNLSTKSEQTRTYKKGKRTVIEKLYAVDENTVITENEVVYVRIQLLTPWLTDSENEIGMGDYTTIQLLQTDNLNIIQLAEQQTNLHHNEDFVIHQTIATSTTTRTRK